MAQMNLSTTQKQTHRHGERTCSCPGGSGGSGLDGEFGVCRCQLLYIGWKNNKALLYRAGNTTQQSAISHNGKEKVQLNKQELTSLGSKFYPIILVINEDTHGSQHHSLSFNNYSTFRYPPLIQNMDQQGQQCLEVCSKCTFLHAALDPLESLMTKTMEDIHLFE